MLLPYGLCYRLHNMCADRMTCACQRRFQDNRVLDVINTYKQQAKSTQWNGLLHVECCQLPQYRPPFVFSNMNRTKKKKNIRERERENIFQSELLNDSRGIWRRASMVPLVLRNSIFLRALKMSQIYTTPEGFTSIWGKLLHA